MESRYIERAGVKYYANGHSKGIVHTNTDGTNVVLETKLNDLDESFDVILGSEESRSTSETSRTNAEVERVSNEAARVIAEDLRETTTSDIAASYDAASKANINVELFEARGGAAKLVTRLNGVDTRLADIAINANAFSTVQEAINYCQTFNKTLLIAETYTLTSEYLKVTAPLTVRWNGGKVIQSTWGYPAFEITSADVIFEGKCKVENTGVKSVITVSSVPGVTDVKSSCSGILLNGATHRFKAEFIHAKNFVAGITMLGLAKNDIYLGRIEVEGVDFGLFGSGFNNMRIDSVLGKSIVKTQGEPEHTVYITGSDAGYRNQGLAIGDIQTDGLSAGTTTVSIKSTYGLSIGNIGGQNILGGMFNAQWSKGIVKSIIATLTGIVSDNAILLQNEDTNIRLEGIEIETDSPVAVINNTLLAACMIVRPRIKLTSTTPNTAIRNTGLSCKVYEPIIEYVNSQGSNYAMHNTAKMDIYSPELIGGSSLVFRNDNAGGSAVYRAILNPNLYDHVLTSISSSNEIYNNSFVDFQIIPLILADADTMPSLRGANVLQSNNSAVRLITKFRRGTNYQKFILVAGDVNTSVQNNANIVLRGGVDRLKTTWNILNFIYKDGVAYEI